MTGRKIPYPWGRLRPERRIEEIEKSLSRMHRQKEILADQYEESLRRIEMNISALQDQVDVAKSFAKEEEWSELRERVYALEMKGVDAMQAIYGKSISESRTIVESLEEQQGNVVDSSEFTDEFLTLGINELDSLFEGEEDGHDD